MRNLIWLAYVVVGVIVASNDNYFENVNNVEEVLEAILAVAVWPLLLFDVSLRF